MTKSSNLNELRNALEKIRQENYPEIPQELIEELLTIEYENQDDRVEAAKKVLKAIDEYLAETEL
ncbi:MAG: DNA modification system-associated small protein [Thermoanaerobacter sp.]|jgi:uncharacterized protein YfeS|uniref:Uncharacterized n=1 Tax=Syntrophomonas zehnderi OL-4 TaxID=690567 RepID=A0A0E3W3Q0_9FIRM|nr:DNA modification system-associated small protein [Syntrophomonas zehnderi]CFX97424.1 Uncharacterized [Syntrophomonas zehnderi OL-4]